MVTDLIQQKLAAINITPDFRDALTQAVAFGEQDAQTRTLRRLPIDVFQVLGGTDEHIIIPFAAAWATLHVVLLRLDHLQDGDPEDEPLPTAYHIGASYNLVLAGYVLANSLIDELDRQSIPLQHLQQLRRLWNECMLISASGQHHDLLHSKLGNSALSPDQYQLIAHAKSGALFALAFTGAAILAGADTNTATACRFIGDVYGALLQLSDDLADRNVQGSIPPLEFLPPFVTSIQPSPSQCDLNIPASYAFFRHVYAAYTAEVERVLAQLKRPEFCTFLRQLFTSSLGGIS
jgi:geranylgeranyl pyrophosphate synthase